MDQELSLMTKIFFKREKKPKEIQIVKQYPVITESSTPVGFFFIEQRVFSHYIHNKKLGEAGGCSISLTPT
jgi:hypothetical protein